MGAYITWQDLGLVILFTLAAIVAIMLALLLKNLSGTVRVIRLLMEKNYKNIDETVKTLPGITKNVEDITAVVSKESQAIGEIIEGLKGAVARSASGTEQSAKGWESKIGAVIAVVSAIKGFLGARKDKAEEPVEAVGAEGADDAREADPSGDGA
ncbi:MAG: hypothetical protein FWE70_07060 [Oscillospiraceae bacterium]|nr:hypothetical protein [Oscillospiraceae bacterium]